MIRIKAVVGVIHTTIQRWVRWYEAGGIEEVSRYKPGHRKTHRQAWTAEQEGRLKEAVSEGRFRTVGEAVRWCAEVFGIEVSEGKVYYWFRRWGYRKKVISAEGGCRGAGSVGKKLIGSALSGGFEARGGGGICG